MNAKFYTYRNLNRGLEFSTKHRGKVVQRSDSLRLTNVTFQVSQAGRLRCLENRKRNVHAFVVSENIPENIVTYDLTGFKEVKYNPYKASSFVSDYRKIIRADEVLLVNGKCYAR